MVTTLLPHVASTPNGTALVDVQGVTSWAALNDQCNRWVWVMRGLGVVPGDRVAVLAGNRRESWEVFLAALHCGVVVVPVSWELDVAQITHVLTHSGARALVVESATEGVGLAGAAEAPMVGTILSLDPPVHGAASASDALAQVPAAEPDNQVAGGPMFYTSGTTGAPKGVVSAGVGGAGQPVESLAATAEAVCSGVGFPRGGTAMIVGPSYHSGQFVLATFALLFGQTLVVHRLPDPHAILTEIDRRQVTNLLLLPKDFLGLLALPPEVRRRFNGRSLRVVLHGGAPCPPDVKQAMIDWFGPVVTEYYGATEGGLFALASSADWLRVPGTVGRVLPFLESRVVDAEGREVAPGQEGVLYFRNRSGATFHYHEDPEKTAAAHLEPGLFTVGDVGYVDDNGYLFVSGREAHLITVEGQRVHPNRIEQVLSGHPAVADVGAFAGPHPSGTGECVHVAVVPTEVAGDLETVLGEHAASRLPPAAIPRFIHVVSEVPRSSAGKILRHELRATLVEGQTTS